MSLWSVTAATSSITTTVAASAPPFATPKTLPAVASSADAISMVREAIRACPKKNAPSGTATRYPASPNRLCSTSPASQTRKPTTAMRRSGLRLLTTR